MSRQRKRDAVLRLLRGEDLETVSRSLGVTAATLTAWREAFLAAGEASLSTRPVDGEDLESGRLKARLGEMLLKQELLEAKIAALEGGRPLAGLSGISCVAGHEGKRGSPLWPDAKRLGYRTRWWTSCCLARMPALRLSRAGCWSS
jgi:transposase